MEDGERKEVGGAPNCDAKSKPQCLRADQHIGGDIPPAAVGVVTILEDDKNPRSLSRLADR
jgi:hypothetical protein